MLCQLPEVVDTVLPSVLSLSLSVPAGSSGVSDEVSAGSGYVVSSDGLVVTNKHVVSVLCSPGQDIQITGLSHDEKAYNLELLSIDAVDDIAILQVQNLETPLIPVQLADSDSLKIRTRCFWL
jgi:S1-C subfamily serine protease